MKKMMTLTQLFLGGKKMHKFTKFFAIVLAIAVLICTFCINALAAPIINHSNHTLGGIPFQTYGELSYSSNYVFGTTTAYRRAGGTSIVTVNIYVNVIVDYTTGSMGHEWDSETGIVYSNNNQYENCSASYQIDTTRTLNYAACEHFSVNDADLSDSGTTSTFVDFSTLCSDFEYINTVILPGIDF